MSAAPLGEFGRIARFLAPLAEACPGALGLRDDGAVLTPPPGTSQAVTVDTMVEGVHFLAGDPPDLIARKLLRVNLSDLASMGAAPWVYLLSLSLPARCDDDWVRRFCAGLAEDQAAFGLALAGGDSTLTPGPITLSATLFGLCGEGTALRRVGAAPGEDVWLSGTVGDGALGLMAALGTLPDLEEPGARAHLLDRYRLPWPRVALGRALIGIARAAMDVSDGLAADAGQLASASGVRLAIRTADLPISDAAAEAVAEDATLFTRILTGGDDYELLFTAPAAMRESVEQAGRSSATQVTRIGRVRTGEGAVLLDKDSLPLTLDRLGWDHGAPS